jgi:phosphonatase-like hydrolase
MTPIELVVFDMAGTTVHDDDAVNVCLRQALLLSGVGVTREAVNAVMGEPKPRAIAKLLTAERLRIVTVRDPEVIEVYSAFEERMLDHYMSDPSVRAAEGADDTFAELKRRGVHIALDTGFHRVIADAILQRLGWSGSGLVDVTVASNEVERGRPYPDLIYRAMALTGVRSPRAVAKVGDTPADLQEGTAAGCAHVIGITTGSHSRNALALHAHTHLVEHLSEVPPICAGIAASR